MTTDETYTCKEHPCAPHGFDRNRSHSEDRYVCECESWSPPSSCAGERLAKELEEAREALRILHDYIDEYLGKSL